MASTGISVHAADVTWNNSQGNFLWNTTDMNWSIGAWNNANGDGAIFGATGAGAITLAQPINANSVSFTANGYSLNGSNALTLVDGTSTQTTGVINTDPGVSATINVPINSAVGFQKIGGGTLTLSGPLTTTASIPLAGNGILSVDEIIGGTSGPIDGGTLRLANTSVLPSTARVGIGNGYLDIGSNNITLGALTFTNSTPNEAWNTTLNANNGVIGSGTLRVTGDINVIGQSGGNFGNTIASNFDLGGGTQVVRVGNVSSFALYQALMFTGSISNGSLLKTIGFNPAGTISTVDGMGLFGNNTYTGSTILNGGACVATGTNASTLVQISGPTAGATASSFTLEGANGSFLSANTIQAFASGQFIIDNNTSLGASGNNLPNIPAAQNNNRISDSAQVQLRDGRFVYRGFSGAAASETYGSLNVLGGFNLLNVTANGAGGTATLTANGNLTLADRSILAVTTNFTGTNATALGAASKVFFNGAIPAADATGILPRIVTPNDFLTYNGTTGLTPFTGYATNLSTPGTNVDLTAATSTNSVAINALKTDGTFTLSINAGQTLTVNSGMLLSANFNTATLSGGTLAFGNTAGVLLGGFTINSAITGTQGLISGTGTHRLAGDLSGLSGPITVQNSTLNLATNTFTGPLEVRNGALNLLTSQTGAGLGALTIGIHENDANLLSNLPVVNVSGAGANAVFDRPIVADNGGVTAAGVVLPRGAQPMLVPLSNTTGSQTFNGDFTLLTGLTLQGGGATGTGATNITGAISGPGTFFLANGRVNLSGAISNTGGLTVSDGGFTAIVNFLGTTSGNVPITLNGGNSSSINYMPNALPTGLITVQNATASTASSIVPMANSTIANDITLNGDVIANVGSGITANWNGVLSGASTFNKAGTGTLVLGNNANTHTGTTNVNAGTLLVQGALPSATVNVNNGGTFGGTGNASGNVNVSNGGILSPGASIGTLATGNLSLSGTFLAEINLNNGGAASADLLNLTGTFNIIGGSLALSLSNLPAGVVSGTYLLVANDGSDPINGTFSSVTGLPAGYSATVDYAYSGTDSLGRIGDGNDLAINVVPEPQTYVLLGLGGLLFLMRLMGPRSHFQVVTSFRRCLGMNRGDRLSKP
jgi:autotransporter-associated beta strand protein